MARDMQTLLKYHNSALHLLETIIVDLLMVISLLPVANILMCVKELVGMPIKRIMGADPAKDDNSHVIIEDECLHITRGSKIGVESAMHDHILEKYIMPRIRGDKNVPKIIQFSIPNTIIADLSPDGVWRAKKH